MVKQISLFLLSIVEANLMIIPGSIRAKKMKLLHLKNQTSIAVNVLAAMG